MNINPAYVNAPFEIAYEMQDGTRTSGPSPDPLRFDKSSVDEALRLMQLGQMEEVRKLSIPKWI
jgi:hypothetical protein